MKIRTMFVTIIVTFGVIFLLISSSLIADNQRIVEMRAQEDITRSLQSEVGDLEYLTTDYLLHREAQQIERWEIKFHAITNDTEKLDVQGSNQKVLVTNIKLNQKNLREIFDSVVLLFGNNSQTPLNQSGLDFIESSWSRMAIQIQGLIFSASRLTQMLDTEADQLNQTNTDIVYSTIGVFVVFFLIFSIIVYVRIIGSINKLKTGAAIVGSGNLDHRIEDRSNDEISELSQSFNGMTGHLKTVIASKSELEIEITKRKRAEAEANRRAEELDIIIASLPDPVVIYDIKAKRIKENDPAKPYFETLDSERWKDATIKKALQGELVWNLERSLKKLNGEERTVLVNSAPIITLGKVTGVVSSLHDISPLKEAETILQERASELFTVTKEALRRADELDTLLASIISPVVLFDLDGDPVRVNPAAKEFFGFDPLGMSGPEFFERLKLKAVPQGSERADLGFLRTSKGEKITNEKFVLTDENGIDKTILSSCSPLWSAGKFSGAVCSLYDITELLDSQKLLFESEERFRLIAESTLVMLSVSRISDGIILYTNPAWDLAFGFKKGEMIGRKAHDIYYDPVDRDLLFKNFRELGELDNYEVRIKNGRGEILWVAVSVCNISYGGQTAILGTSIDITQRKNADEAARQGEKRYRELFNSMIEGFCIVEVVFDSNKKPIDYRFLEVNEAFDAQTGLHNAKGKLMRELVPEQEQDWFDIYGKVAVTGITAKFENKAKELNRWFNVRAFRVGGEGSNKVAISFYDITEQKKAEKALRDR
jgi:PAS domain S-box-containing protein